MRPPEGRPAATPSIDPPPARLALIDPARVAAIVPAWNETGKIGDVVRKVPRRWAATVIVVDDHSSDDSAGEARLVQGSRWLPGGATPGIPPDRRWLTQLYPLLFRIASGHAVTDGTNGLRAFRLSLLDDPRIQLEQDWLDRYELEPYLLYQAMRGGYRVTEAPVTVRYHGRGTTKMRLKDGWRILRPLVYLRLGWRS